MRIVFVFCLMISVLHAHSQPLGVPVGTVLPTAQVPVHDPVMIKQGDTFYVFCTGVGIAVWSSTDLQTWQKQAPVFARAPQWAVDTIPNFKGHIWAPDISFHNGLYYLYYSVSTFGKNSSAIGVATNRTLDPSSPDFKWQDHGRVIQSYPRQTPWNAIDPNLVTDDKGKPYLAFGSFWEGIKLVELKPDLLHASQTVDRLPTIASRKSTDTTSGANPIEGAFIFKKRNWFYLFASIDYCCQGLNSTYKLIVGRSKNLAGPYVDQHGAGLSHGGGTILIQGNKDWHGVGHNGICSDGDNDYIVYHGYDANDNGRSKLLVQKLEWAREGWPVVKDIQPR